MKIVQFPSSILPCLLINISMLYVARSLKTKRSLSAPFLRSKYFTSLSESPVTQVPIEIPLTDKRDYVLLTLKNNLRCIVVSDPTSTKSAAALVVRAGAAFDDLPGMAHFTEHMLFLGSRKYPKENSYKEYLSKHGGSSNGATGMEYTSYFFSVNANKFEGALDIFAQFFIDPLFNDDAVFREVQAVDSEDSKNRILDGRRSLQVYKSLLDESHPYSKFSTGNRHTLTENNNVNNTLKAMHAFYEKHYRPDLMTLSLVGPQTVAELTELAHTYFSDVKASDPTAAPPALSSLQTSSPIYPFLQSGYIIRMRPIKDARDVSILWHVPKTRYQYRKKPFAFIGYLLSNKSPQGLHTRLQDRGWISSMSAGISTEFNDFSSFEISFSLTPSGCDNWKTIVKYMYEYLNLVSNLPDDKFYDIWKEMKACSDLNFRYQEKTDANSLAPTLASNLNFYPAEHIVSVGSLLDDISSDDLVAMKQLMARLTPELSIKTLRNVDFASWIPEDGIFGHASKEHTDILKAKIKENAEVGEAANSIDKYYGVPFHKERFHEIDLKEWTEALNSPPSSGFGIPDKNRFVPYELTNTVDNCSVPISSRTTNIDVNKSKLHSSPPSKLIASTSSNDIWVSKDTVFGFPKSVFVCQLNSKATHDGHPVNSMVTNLFSQTVARKYFQVQQTGLFYSVNIGVDGINMAFQGFSPQLAVLASDVSRDFGDNEFWSKIDDSLFLNVKERLIRSIKGWNKERPDSQCDTLLGFLLLHGSWLPIDRLVAANDLTIASVVNRASLMMVNPTVMSYLHGDLDAKTAVKINAEIIKNVAKSSEICAEKSLQSPSEYHRPKLLPRGQHTVVAMPVFNEDEGNNALVCHMQTAVTTPQTVAELMIVRQLLAEPLFTELRTKQQLGYIVGVGSQSFGKGLKSIRGLSFRILSKQFSPIHLERALGAFLESQQQVFYDYKEEALKERVEAIITSLEDPPTSYSDEAGEFWGHILDSTAFDWKEQVIVALRAITIQDVKRAGDEWVFDKSKRASVSFMLFGNQHSTELSNNKLISSRHDFFSSDGTIVNNINELKKIKSDLSYLY